MIDWQAPWLAPYRERGLRVAQRWQAGGTLVQALNAEGEARFVEQAALPDGEAYEAFVFRTGRVPTRDNLHDFFNGLVWLAQPALKAELNRRQAAEIARDGVGATRGPVRDALTLFDENGALLQAPPALVDALRERDWGCLFVTQRALWRDATLTLVGHALLEKLAQPRKPITAHVLAGTGLAGVDWADKPFAPLPVLGVPGWWPGNEQPAFYDDAAVFRPAGSLRSTGSARPCRS